MPNVGYIARVQGHSFFNGHSVILTTLVENVGHHHITMGLIQQILGSVWEERIMAS